VGFASGAVSGVLAAYLVLYPKARVWVLLFLLMAVVFTWRLNASYWKDVK